MRVTQTQIRAWVGVSRHCLLLLCCSMQGKAKRRRVSVQNTTNRYISLVVESGATSRLVFVCAIGAVYVSKTEHGQRNIFDNLVNNPDILGLVGSWYRSRILHYPASFHRVYTSFIRLNGLPPASGTIPKILC